MTSASAQARHLSLVRLEQAAGQVFGFTEEPAAQPSRASLFLTPTTIGLATFATALAATLTYLV